MRMHVDLVPVLIVAFTLGACASSPSSHVGGGETRDSGLPVPPPASVAGEQVVILEGRIECVGATGKRHQSYMFKFDAQRAIIGDIGERWYAFELYHDFGGARLLADLGIDRRNISARMTPSDGRMIMLELKKLPAQRTHAARVAGAASGEKMVALNCRLIAWSTGGEVWRWSE